MSRRWIRGQEVGGQSNRCLLVHSTFLLARSAHPTRAGDHVVNMREDIFKNRVKYSVTSTASEASREEFLDDAIKGLER